MRRYLLIALIVIASVFGWLLYRDNSAQQPEPPRATLPTQSPNATTPKEIITPAAKPDATTPKTPIATELSPAKLTTPVSFIDNAVPFIVQAPTGEWDDERQQDGCEEASALMAMRWVQNKRLSGAEARREILAISDYEQNTYGEFRDISVEDVRDWIFKDYFKYENIVVRRDVTVTDIIAELQAGRVMVAPMQGQELENPFFSGDGPERHMLVIRGYDPVTKEFITNDPGTRRGEAYRYKQDILMDALLAYSTGSHEPVSGDPKAVVVVGK